ADRPLGRLHGDEQERRGVRDGSPRLPQLRRRRKAVAVRRCRRLHRRGRCLRRGAVLDGRVPMLRLVTQRVPLIIPTFLGAALLTFTLIHLIPGDPIQMLLGEKVIDPERHAALLRQIGLDRPLYIQFLDYVWHVLQGDLGKSIVTKNTVLADFFTLFPATLELASCAMVFAIVLAIPAGVLAAQKRGSIYDHTLMGAALTGYSMPIFWWGLLLILFFSIFLGWTPVSGRIDLDYYFDEGTGFMLYDSLVSDQEGAFASAVSHLILPSIVLGTIPLAVISRMTRSAMLEVLGEDYVRTAYAK